MAFEDRSRMVPFTLTKVPWGDRWTVIYQFIRVIRRGEPVMMVTPTHVTMAAFSDAVPYMIAMIEEGFEQAGEARLLEKTDLSKKAENMLQKGRE